MRTPEPSSEQPDQPITTWWSDYGQYETRWCEGCQDQHADWSLYEFDDSEAQLQCERCGDFYWTDFAGQREDEAYHSHVDAVAERGCS